MITTAVIGRVLGQYVLDWLHERKVRKKLQKDPITIKEIKVAASDRSKIYIRQDCQDNDPAAGEAPVQLRPIFAELDYLLGPPLHARCIMILADSGMGKTALLSKYYAYHWSSAKRSARFDLLVVPLNRPDADEVIGRVPAEKRNQTVLFLDALDEDPFANMDCQKRLEYIAGLAEIFYCVLITCRTQFFSNEAAITIPALIPVIAGPVSLGETPPISFKKIYMSPFSNIQMRHYLWKRFLLRFHPIIFRSALRTAKRFADLISRPMLLTYIQDLVNEKRELQYTFEVYQTIVEEWLKREITIKNLAKDATKLLDFSYKMAGELFAKGLDRLPENVLKEMADSFIVELKYHNRLHLKEIQQRSLLNRDDRGNWKFAHRSIMEYLLVRECFNLGVQPFWVLAGKPWTNEMKVFASEMSCSKQFERFTGINIKGIDLDFMVTPFTGAKLNCSFTVRDIVYHMHWIRPGKFDMGSPAEEKGRSNDEKQHEVILTNSFWLSETAVTRALWIAVMGTNPRTSVNLQMKRVSMEIKRLSMKKKPTKFNESQLPVECVSWDDCQEFIRKINQMKPGLDLRLPTEAEWEYACRAGTKTKYYWGDEFDKIKNYAWWKGNSEGCTHPVGKMKANPWGLYDMIGNVWEWCQDYYGKNYQENPKQNPTGPAGGSDRVLRGGCYWNDSTANLRSAYRNKSSPAYGGDNFGFRFLRSVP